MRSERQFLDEYAVSHQNPTNLKVHLVCVPLIFMATLGLLWLVPLGAWLGLPESVALWVNGATVVTLPVLAFYARLSSWSLQTGILWLAISYAALAVLWCFNAPILPLLAAVWVLAWIGQFWGHRVEGAKPSFADDLVFLLIGPLFVQRKLQVL